MGPRRTAILRNMPTYIPLNMFDHDEWRAWGTAWVRRGRYVRGDQVIGYTVAIYNADGCVTRVRHFRF